MCDYRPARQNALAAFALSMRRHTASASAVRLTLVSYCADRGRNSQSR